MITQTYKKQWTSLIPQGKMGQTQKISWGAVTFLSSDASGYVTGADLRGQYIQERRDCDANMILQLDGGYTKHIESNDLLSLG